MTHDAFAMEYKPPLRSRMWRRLGFRYTAFAGRPDLDSGFYTVHRVTTHWDWRDRLRILFSGHTEAELCVETDALPTIMSVRQSVVVMAPDATPKK